MRKLIILTFLVFLFSLSFASASLGNGVISYYNFDEDSGKLIDVVNGTFNSTSLDATQGESGIINDAYDFEDDGGDNQYVTIDSAQINQDYMTISMWINPEEWDTGNLNAIWYGDNSSGDPPSLRQNNGNLEFVIEDSLGNKPKASTGTLPQEGEWSHIVGSYNGTDALLYVNGTLVDFASAGAESTLVRYYITEFARRPIVEDNNYDGKIDEVGFWNRSLTSTEVENLYNDENGNSYPFTDLFDVGVELDSPSDNFDTIKEDVNFNSTLTPIRLNLTNATLMVWNSSSELDYELTNTVTGDSQNSTNFSISNVGFETYEWNVFACGENSTNDATCSFANSNRTFTRQRFSVIGENYANETLETENQKFEINITIPDATSVRKGILSYNGTNYTGASFQSTGENDYTLSKEINIPAGTQGFTSELRDFFWYIELSDENTGDIVTRISSTNQQNVTELIFRLCDSEVKNPVLNFTFKDENSGNEINATKNATNFEAVFDFWVDDPSVVKTYSIINQSVNQSKFDFCTDLATNKFQADAEIEYSAVGYVDKAYYLNNASLNGNSTNSIDLFLLQSADAIQFFLEVLDGTSPVSDVIVSIEKYALGDGVYKTVDVKKTDDSGEFTSYLELDEKYKFTIRDRNTNDIKGIFEKTSSCKVAPCEITLELEGDDVDVFSGWNSAFANDVVYNISFDHETKMVNFEFVDTSGLATSFRLKVSKLYLNQTSKIICNKRIYTSSGSISCNVTGYSGDFLAEGFVTRSPDQLVNYFQFSLAETADSLGMVGLIMSMFLILLIIFSLSFKPSMIILSVPLSILLIKISGLLAFSMTFIVVTFIIAILAAIAIEK